jgi:hypothetical protein
VTDENMKPIAVQIDYADWLKIEKSDGHSTVNFEDGRPVSL